MAQLDDFINICAEACLGDFIKLDNRYNTGAVRATLSRTRWARAATLTGDPHGRHAPRGRRGPAARSAPCERGRSGARERPPSAKPQEHHYFRDFFLKHKI